MSKNRIELVKFDAMEQPQSVSLDAIPQEVTEEDNANFFSVISTDLTPTQQEWVRVPDKTYPRQTEVLAVHWHPEFVPMDMIMDRVENLYPHRTEQLIIPTQHNELLSLNGYSGVEVDCYSHGFNRKVQLLLHFKSENIGENAAVLQSMLKHTFKYRSGQLFEFLDTIIDDSMEERRQQAASKVVADETLVEFCRLYARKLKTMIEDNWMEVPEVMIKNKLLRNFMNTLRPTYGDRFIANAQVFLKAVKDLVKANFSLQYFYRASEIIEEARTLNAGVVIPHPEQFWPILLAGYDVDGVEVWNPQSSQYTEFLITVIQQQNRSRDWKERPLLVFMGDDCHMGEKTIAPETRDPEKGSREIGLQPAWDDMAIRKNLIISGYSRKQVIDEYKQRLG